MIILIVLSKLYNFLYSGFFFLFFIVPLMPIPLLCILVWIWSLWWCWTANRALHVPNMFSNTQPCSTDFSSLVAILRVQPYLFRIRIGLEAEHFFIRSLSEFRVRHSTFYEITFQTQCLSFLNLVRHWWWCVSLIYRSKWLDPFNSANECYVNLSIKACGQVWRAESNSSGHGECN